MLAYHNDPQLKQQILQQLQGSNLNLPVEQFENNLGIPMVLAHLEDVIFEGLPNEEAKNWPINFMSSIQVGANLSTIWRDFVVWLLIDPIDGVIKHTTPGTDAHEVIIRVANLYRDGYTTQQMRDACDAAYAVANAASATASATCSVAYAVIYYSANAARSAAAAAATAATRSISAAAAVAHSAAYATAAVFAAVDAHSITATSYAFDDYTIAAIYTKMSNKLIELLQQRMPNVSLP